MQSIGCKMLALCMGGGSLHVHLRTLCGGCVLSLACHGNMPSPFLNLLPPPSWQAVAAAALCASALMNAPPGFLEFLLCVPWRKLPLLYPKPGETSASSEPAAAPEPASATSAIPTAAAAPAAMTTAAGPELQGEPRDFVPFSTSTLSASAAPSTTTTTTSASGSAAPATTSSTSSASAQRTASIDKLISNLSVTDEERRLLTNTKLHPALLQVRE